MDKRMMQRLAVWCLIAFVLFTVFRQFSGERTVAGNLDQTSYTQFMDDAKPAKFGVWTCRDDALP